MIAESSAGVGPHRNGRLARLVSWANAPAGLYDLLQSAARVFAIRVLGAGLAYASMILLARWLGSHEFGIYAYVLAIVTLLALAFSIGFSSSGLRFVASYLARNRLRRLAGFLDRAYRIVLGASVLCSLACAGVVIMLRDWIAPHYFVPLLVGLACVPLWTLLNQLEATARAFGWLTLAYAPGYVLRPLLIIAGVGGVVLFGHAADAVGALWVLLAACAAAALAQGLAVHAGTRRRLAHCKPTFHTRHWFAASLAFLTIDGFRMLLDNTDVLLVGRLLDPHSVAIYVAAIRTAGLVAFVSFSVLALAVPRIAEIHAAGNTADLQKFVSDVIRLMFWPSLLAAVALAGLGPFVLSLFGQGFAAAYPAMLVVLAGLVLRAATGPVEYLLNMTGHQRDTLRVYALAAAANVALNLLLIPAFGIVGAAVATYAAMLGANAALYRLVRKRLGVSAFILPLRRAGAAPRAAKLTPTV